MPYKIIELPFTTRLEDLSKQELRAYQDWFLSALPERTEILSTAVRSTPGFENWTPDLTPTSLEQLGLWFAQQVQTRPRTPAEIDKINSKSAFAIEVENYVLTHRTLSLAVDIGMYLGRVFVAQYPKLKWIQTAGSKRNVDFGQMTVTGFNGVPMNTVRITIVFAYGIARGSRTGHGLLEIYNTWSRRAP